MLRNSLLASLVFFAASMSTSTHAEQNDVVRFALGEWQPYTSADDGILEKIVLKIYNDLGLEVEFAYYPWMRSAKLVEYGKADATFPWYATEERRATYLLSTTPLLHADTVMFYHNSVNLEWNELADLAKYRLGAVDGYTVTQLMQENGLTPVIASDLKENFLKLHRARVDAIPAEKRVGRNMVNLVTEGGTRAILVNPKPLLSDPMHVLFQPTERGKKLQAIYEKGIHALKQSGCYEIMLENNPCPE